MRLLLSVVIICCLISISVAAETEQKDWKNHKPVAGDNAFLFQTGTNLNIRSYSGLLFAGRHHFSTTRAIELGIGFNGSTFVENIKHENFEDSLIVWKRNDDGYSWSTRFSAVYLMYFDRPSNLMPFWGIGPAFQYYYSYSDYGNYSYLYYSESRNIGVGLICDIGFEWFILPRISLAATYKMKLLYGWETYTYERSVNNESDKRTSKTRLFDFEYQNTNLGVALYF
ncbi:hypothetical protein K9N50_04410 [bacterium]|nr:hypothetical protein [bacterium]